VGFALGEATISAAKKYPGIKFIGVDQFQVKPVPNVAGLVFHEDRAGFQAGALAAMLTRSNIIAAVLATDMVPPVAAFKRGYEAGADSLARRACGADRNELCPWLGYEDGRGDHGMP
jgi:basic membrane protein A